MKVVIDLDSHEAIQDFTIRNPAPPYEFKSQDTVEWELYFVHEGNVQDLGAGFALKFGMIRTGDLTNTILAYQTTFAHLTDANGNVYYSGLVNFNTAQMATAIGTNPSINGTAEIRYQDSINEIIHTIGISTIVYATIIVETGVTPPNVSTGYPDASTIELLVHKNVANGYAGLDAGGDLNGSVIPVDTQTIVINANGDIASAAILASATANWTTPASGGNVTVTVDSTANLKALSYVRIPIAGYYIVESITDSTHVVLQNNGDPFNAIAGVTITTGSVLLPAQAAAGGGAGQGAYTATTAAFTVPALGAAVTISVGSTAWMGGAGYGMFITGAGYYLVSSVIDSTHVSVTNSGSGANALQGTNVASGATVSAAGPMGPQGANGQSLASYDTTSASFTMPNAASSVNVVLSNSTAWMTQGQVVYIAGAGYFQVASIINATNVSLTNLNYPGNAAAASTIAAGAHIGPGGLQGAAGAGGAGLNAFTTLTSSFTQPAINSTVAIVVGTTAWMATGQAIFIAGGGYYSVTSIADLTHVTVTNLGYPGNAAPAATVTGSGTQGVNPAGLIGSNGGNAYTTTTASFSQPVSGTNVTISVAATAWMAQNQNLFINGGGYYQVVNIASATSVVIQNLGSSGNIASGSTVSSGAAVVAAGATGLTGATGPQGAVGPSGGIGEAPTDGQIYGRQNSAWTPVIGGGGGGPIYPSARIFDQDDFDGSIISVSGPNGKLGWLCKTAGAGSIVSGSNQGANSTDKAKGVWSFTGSTTGDYAAIALGDFTAAAGAKPTMVPGLGILQLEFRINIGALPTGTQDLVIALGLCNNATAISTVTPNDAVQFFYWFGNAITNWRCSTIAGGTATNTSSGIAATAGGGQWHKFQLLTNAGWTSIQFKIDGTVVATNTTTIPTVNLCPFLRVGNGSSGTWASAVYVDYYYHDYQYAR